MIKLERASAVETVRHTWQSTRKARPGAGRNIEASKRVAQAVRSHLDQTAGCARARILSL